MDVFQVVKALRIQKPGSVLTVVSMSNLHVQIAGQLVLHSRNIEGAMFHTSKSCHCFLKMTLHSQFFNLLGMRI